MNDVLKFIRSLNLGDNYVIVGCSGGPDSMCLLDVLNKMHLKVVCAHVNHNIRIESEDEYKYVENFCHKRGIVFEGLVIEKGNHNEAYYRKKRYDFYKKLADQYSTKYIMTAHHGDDLIETILMRIARGSKLEGYRGFDKIYNERGYVFIKPLVYVTKDEIIEYDDENNIEYMIDKTNNSDDYTRNRYRHHVLPFLKEENPKIHLKYLKFSESIKDAYDFIEKNVQRAIEDNYSNYIDINKFMTLDDYIKRKELEKILSDIYRDDIDKIKSVHISKVLDKLKDGDNFEIDLPLGYVFRREYSKLYIDKPRKVEGYDYILDNDISLPNGYKIIFSDDNIDNSNYSLRLSSEDVSLPLHVRTRRPKDRMEVKNLGGVKSIKSIFIDEKIPKEIRNIYPVVTDSENKIVWIPGLKKSKFDIKSNEINKKYDIILAYKKERER